MNEYINDVDIWVNNVKIEGINATILNVLKVQV